MNKRQQKRLLNVAKVLREEADPDYFTMRRFGFGRGDLIPSRYGIKHRFAPECGTPCCALGYYAANTKIQKVFNFDPHYGQINFVDKNEYDEFKVAGVHFGISDKPGSAGKSETDDLFGAWGCGGAVDPRNAARYIENFVKRKIKSQKKKRNGKARV